MAVVCSAILIAVGCTSDPTADSLETRTEDSTRDRSESSETAEGSTIESNGESVAGNPADADSTDPVQTTDEQGDADPASAADGATPGVDGAKGIDVNVDGANVDVAEAVGDILVETGEDLTGDALAEHIADRFEAFWLAFDLARTAPSASPETDYPALLDLAAGEQLDGSYQALRDLHRSGQAIRNPETPAVPGLDVDSALRVRIDSVDGGVAELTSCLVNDRVRYEVATGAGVGGSVTTVMARSTMAKSDGSWKLIRSEPVALDPGVAGCWVENRSDFKY